MIPKVIPVNNCDVPPILIRGKVTPVTGSNPTTTHILIIACIINAKLRPALNKPPNGFDDLMLTTWIAHVCSGAGLFYKKKN